jgi:NCS1 family nucleobase:cation symporter-1
VTATSGDLTNRDLAPISPAERTWNLWHIASLWVGMSVCIPSYMLASSMVGAGLSWRLSLLAIVLGYAIVLAPLVITAHAGTRYGIPFPIFGRAAFGVRRTHVPSLVRAVVACGWTSILARGTDAPLPRSVRAPRRDRHADDGRAAVSR